MVEVMLGFFGVAGNLAEFGDVRNGDNQIPAAGLKVDSENAGVFRCRLIGMWVGQAWIAIAGSHILNTAEVWRHGCSAIRTNGIDGVGNHSLFAGEDVEYVTDKPVVLSVVPDNLAFRAGQPLQHTALLPAP